MPEQCWIRSIFLRSLILGSHQLLLSLPLSHCGWCTVIQCLRQIESDKMFTLLFTRLVLRLQFTHNINATFWTAYWQPDLANMKKIYRSRWVLDSRCSGQKPQHHRLASLPPRNTVACLIKYFSLSITYSAIPDLIYRKLFAHFKIT